MQVRLKTTIACLPVQSISSSISEGEDELFPFDGPGRGSLSPVRSIIAALSLMLACVAILVTFSYSDCDVARIFLVDFQKSIPASIEKLIALVIKKYNLKPNLLCYKISHCASGWI